MNLVHSLVSKLNGNPGLPSIRNFTFCGCERQVPGSIRAEASGGRSILRAEHTDHQAVDNQNVRLETLTFARLMQGVPGTRLAQNPFPHPPEFGTVLIVSTTKQ